MSIHHANAHPVLIIGAGRGGAALLEMFLEDRTANVICVVDPKPEAQGIKIAQAHGIPTCASVAEALHACRDYKDCIVYNLTHDDAIAGEVAKVFENKKVTGGAEARLFWQIVTNMKETKKQLEQNQRHLQAIIHNAMDGIITINERGEIEAFNPAAERIFGYAQHEVLGRNLSMLMPEPARGEHEHYINRYLQTGNHRIIRVAGREVTALRRNGEHFPMELSVSEMVSGGQCHFIGMVRDVTERKQAEQKIAYQAHHDYLTGLPNRALFLDRLEHACSAARRNGSRGALLFLDLDGFKQVNDSLGHEVGDLLLKEVAKRLLAVTRAADTLARMGGDEFTMLLDNADEEEAASAASRIIAQLSSPFDLHGRLKVGCSIGIALFPDDTEDCCGLIRRADQAMYLSKQRGKNTYTIHAAYSPGMSIN